MSSRNKRKQVRHNGAQSAGTKSSAIIPNSTLNSLQYGSNCRVLVLESTHLATYIETFLPTDGVEMKLVEEMVAAKWRQQRIWVIQTTALDLEMNSQRKEFQDFEKQNDCQLLISEPSFLALSFTAIANKEKTLELLHRQETGYARMHDRAMKSLHRLREESKLQNDPNLVDSEPVSAASGEPEAANPNPKYKNYKTTPIVVHTEEKSVVNPNQGSETPFDQLSKKPATQPKPKPGQPLPASLAAVPETTAPPGGIAFSSGG